MDDSCSRQPLSLFSSFRRTYTCSSVWQSQRSACLVSECRSRDESSVAQNLTMPSCTNTNRKWERDIIMPNPHINIPFWMNVILPEFSIFCLHILTFRWTDCVPLRRAKRELIKDETTRYKNWYVCFDRLGIYLSLQAPVHSTWPQGLRTRTSFSFRPL